MRGLLIKDVRFTMQNKKMLAVFLFIVVALLAMQGKDGFGFIIAYMTMMCGMLVLSTISVDEFDKSSAFLMTMPVDRAIYVKEKYVFSFGCSLAGWVIAVIPCALMQTENIKELLLQAVVIFVVLSFFWLIMLPVQLKFGGDKGRMVLLAMVAVIMIGAFLIKKIGETVFASQAEAERFFAKIISWFSSLNGWLIGIVVLGIWLACMVISYAVSRRIMENREF